VDTGGSADLSEPAPVPEDTEKQNAGPVSSNTSSSREQEMQNAIRSPWKQEPINPVASSTMVGLMIVRW
jgi:hypothetical protein